MRFAWFVLPLSLSACTGGGGGKSEHFPFGTAQKGPFIVGSTVEVQELDGDLDPSGDFFSVQTDALGAFEIADAINSSRIEAIGEGYFFDEITGAASTSPITLRAICDLTDNSSCNLNVVTTLQTARLRALRDQGESFNDAYEQSRADAFAVFHIDASALPPPDDMDIVDVSTPENGAGLAASIVMLELAHWNAGFDASLVPSQLSQDLAEVAADLAPDGIVSTAHEFALATRLIQRAEVRAQLEAEVGQTVPPFEDYLDHDWDGTTDQLDPPIIADRIIETDGATTEACGDSVAVVGTFTAIGNQCGADGALYDASGTFLNTIVGGRKVLAIADDLLLVTDYSTNLGYVAVPSLVRTSFVGQGTFGSAAQHGTALLIGFPDESFAAASDGVVHLHSLSDGAVLRTFNVPSDNVRLGASLVSYGGRVFAGAGGANQVVVFDAQSAAVLDTLDPPAGITSTFGQSMVLVGDRLFIGAPYSAPGHVVALDADDGAHLFTIESPSSVANAGFGYSLAVSGGKLLIGAPGDTTTMESSGAVYVADPVTGVIESTIFNPIPHDQAYFTQFGIWLSASATRFAVGRTPGTPTPEAFLFTP